MEFWRLRLAGMNAIKIVLLRTHPFWSRLVPGFYYPYRFAGGRVYLDITESKMMLARALRRYEPVKLRAIESLLPRGGVFVDVGANKGDFSLVAARVVGPEGRVLAFEPEPVNCQWARKSIELNGYRHVEMFEMALSDRDGEAQLYIGAKSGWHSLVTRAQEGPGQAPIAIRCRRLDDVAGDLKLTDSVDMMKIDVEGGELEVLRGATEVLTRSRDIILLIDIHPDLGVAPAAVCRHLKGLGFSIFQERPPFTLPVTDEIGVRAIVARRVTAEARA